MDNNKLKYELRCCNRDQETACHPYIFAVISIDDIKFIPISYFTIFDDLSGIAPLKDKFWKISDLKIISEVVESNKELIPKLIRKFNKNQRAFKTVKNV